VDLSDTSHRDSDFIRAVIPYLDAITSTYFRPEYEETRHIPASGPFIAVGNHNGGPMLADLWTLLPFWERHMGPDLPMYAMVHDIVFRVPVAGRVFLKLGGLRACAESARRALRTGAGVLIYPGGELDCCRTFWSRNQIACTGALASSRSPSSSERRSCLSSTSADTRP
jgi:1-acyl-sn-glycerol-3-phosphate acyltransferase